MQTKMMTGAAKTVMALVAEAATEGRATDIILAKEKTAARKLESAGLVKIEVTSEKCAGLAVWKVSAAA